MNDDFFENLRKKDLTKIKKFDFKKAKTTEDNKNFISPVKTILNQVPNKVDIGNAKINKIDYKDNTRPNSNLHTQNGVISSLNSRGNNTFSPRTNKNTGSGYSNVYITDREHSFSGQESGERESSIINNSEAKPQRSFTVNKNQPNISRASQIQQRQINPFGINPTPTSHEKRNPDSILDSLYKNSNIFDSSPPKSETKKVITPIVKPKLTLNTPLFEPKGKQDSPSLLSRGRLTQESISKYFTSKHSGGVDAKTIASPLKKLLLPKDDATLKEKSRKISCDNISMSFSSNTEENSTFPVKIQPSLSKTNTSTNMQVNTPFLKEHLKGRLDTTSKAETSLDNNVDTSPPSPVVKPKKFVFKKRTGNISISNELRKDLVVSQTKYADTGQGNIASGSAPDNTKNKLVIEREVNCISLLSSEEVKSTQYTPEATLASNASTPTLDITDADYMNDDEFGRQFGSFLESIDQLVEESGGNCINNVQSTSKASESGENTAELLNEISNMEWDENFFDDEPVETGFKDRTDDSDEFRGNYEHSEVMMEVLHQKFGLRNFRPHQREIINASLMQHDCFVLMPTGGGKSLCYQLPAILMPGVTIVVSPLRALISDQVDKLNALDIAASHLCSDVSKAETDNIYAKLSMREPGVKLLYLTPEKLSCSRNILEILDNLYSRGKLARFVIDEVHCLSQWGHDFRPDYKQLGKLRQNYKDVPIICLTATATKQVENDVINILKLKNVKRFIRSFNRPNIKYEVIEKPAKSTEVIANLIKTKFPKKSGIVYCLARKDCEKVTDEFRKLGLKAKPYHAGMNDKVREAIQREWMQDSFHIIVATIAFGMGIDKPDVRFVIHNSVPKSVEAFYQESGRAGRDGEVSYSYLFYAYRDVDRLRKLIKLDRNMNKKTLDAHEENLKQMVGFAENRVDCRRYLQLIHLGEHFDRRICIKSKATICDNCQNIDKYKSEDVSKQAKELCTLVRDLTQSGNVTMLYVADVYRGSKLKKIVTRGHDRHPLSGAGASIDRNDVQRILKELLLKQILANFFTYTGEFPVVYIKTGPKFYQFLNSDYKLTISVCTEGKSKEPKRVAPAEKPTGSGWIDAQSGSSSTLARSSTNSDGAVVRHTVQKQNGAKLQAARKLQLSKLKVECHEALLEECRRIAMERNLTLSSVMNLSAIQSMSNHLPKTKEEMLKIQHITVANYSKYGEYFLKITRQYREKHDAIQPLTELKKPVEDLIEEGSGSECEGDFQSSGSQRFSSNNSRGRGVKRKTGSWGNKRGGFKRRRVASKKKGTSPKGKMSSSGWKGKRGGRGGGGAGGGLGLMPVLHIK